ncbi:uncharacterized protein J7T54_006764 [Emericellopsis cladophorae]|uniref:Uncharacterized protein n=1 Tax=Emericellopsis cladophorae TaxID=2686198 RepID=A0A9Q0BH35_9HYPO|nr:uncharacterized protein J7T54_006764 [Emericellopsis cladophorae]KAI6785122.1 hypothetical protein J7T54_006764 [Emericellopsis cladophorae]
MSSGSNNDANTTPRDESPPGSPPSASVSLQAAATLNAGLRRSSNSSLRGHQSPNQLGRRRSILMNLQHNDPTMPAPGEMVSEQHSHAVSPQLGAASPSTADPHHHRAPSLGELHQELEAEQEAQVVSPRTAVIFDPGTDLDVQNRLLQQIRQQQLELSRLRESNPSALAENSSAVSERSIQGTPIPQQGSQQSLQHAAPPSSYSRSPSFRHNRMSGGDLTRADLHRRSRTPSRGASPRLRSTSISQESGDWALGGRDESAFYQAETQMLTRENQMLRHRIRELEKQLSEVSGGGAASNAPSMQSSLMRSTSNVAEADASEEGNKGD